MRIVIITQNEPFYLGENIDYLISILPTNSTIVGCVVNDVSPFGKKESFIKKANKTLSIFGLKFFLHYSFKFIKSKLSSKGVLKILQKHDIPVIRLESNINSNDSVALIKSYNPDILVSILGNQIFKEPIINLAPKGCINLHTALLPKYRGLMPTFWVLKNNETHTGVSVFFVDRGIDSGPIIVQETIEILDKTQEQLIRETKKIGMEAIAKAIALIDDDSVKLISNNENEMTYFSFPTKEDVHYFKSNGKKFF